MWFTIKKTLRLRCRKTQRIIQEKSKITCMGYYNIRLGLMQ